MKNVIFSLAVLSIIFVSCSKPKINELPTETKDVFYRIVEVDNSGKLSISETKRINVTFNLSNVDRKFVSTLPMDTLQIDYPNTLAVNFTLFNLSLISQTDVKIDWIVDAEINTNYYVIQRSMDNKNWLSIKQINKGKNTYSVIDNLIQ